MSDNPNNGFCKRRQKNIFLLISKSSEYSFRYDKANSLNCTMKASDNLLKEALQLIRSLIHCSLKCTNKKCNIFIGTCTQENYNQIKSNEIFESSIFAAGETCRVDSMHIQHRELQFYS